jgi:alpha-D-ribose 1-methylphosphonate 5-triphosphate diphosphatase
MSDIQILGGPCIADGRIIAPAGPARLQIDAAGLDILPGLIDVHGDAFERALQPRPGVNLPVHIALSELEAHLLAAGITTAYIAITLSWEAGLRSRATYEAVRDAMLARPGAAPDLRLHVRFEAHNLDCLDLLLHDISAGHIGMVSFNDHTPGILRRLHEPATAVKYAERAGQTLADFAAAARAAAAVSPEAIMAGRAHLAQAARRRKIPMASHDDANLEARANFRALGSAISEFPMTETVARDAVAHGEDVVMGAPNVVRGGSHMGWHGAEAMVKDGVCTVLCSDYHYPSLLHAPYIIARNASATFPAAIALVTANAASMSGLTDRGTLNPGARADIILVDPAPNRATPRVIASIAHGSLAYLAPDATPRLKIADENVGWVSKA